MPPAGDGPRLVIEWEGVGTMAHPLPLPGDFEDPWRFVEMVGWLVPEERRRATWYVTAG